MRLAFSKSKEQHQEDPRKVLSILQENNLQISVDKCQFYKDAINFLGYNVSTEGLKPTS